MDVRLGLDQDLFIRHFLVQPLRVAIGRETFIGWNGGFPSFEKNRVGEQPLRGLRNTQNGSARARGRPGGQKGDNSD